MQLRPVSRIGLLVCSAVLLSLSYSRALWWLPALVAFIPLLQVISRAPSWRSAFRDGFIFGCIFYALTLYWLCYVASWWAIFVFCYCAVYTAVFALLVRVLVFRPYRSFYMFFIRSVFLIPLIGVCLEFVRAKLPVLGFAWALLGYSQATNHWLLALARFGGVYLLSAVVLGINAVLYMLFCVPGNGRTRKGKVVAGSIAGALIVSMGVLAHASFPGQGDNGVCRIGVVQPNIPQQMKWEPQLKDLIVKKTGLLAELVAREHPDIIIFPEAAYPGNLSTELDQSYLKEVSERVHIPFIIGAPNVINPWTIYNSAFLITDGVIKQVYNKLRLVPFGEYIPFRRFFTFLGLDKVAYSMGVGDFSAGKKYTLFPLPGSSQTAGVLICFEDTISSLARTFCARGAALLINITNDAWFEDTSAPYQHLQASILRAVENGVPVIRAANTGVSAYISPEGVIRKKVMQNGHETFVDGGFVCTIPLSKGQQRTVYQAGGYLFPRLCIVLLAIAVIYIRKGREKKIPTY